MSNELNRPDSPIDAPENGQTSEVSPSQESATPVAITDSTASQPAPEDRDESQTPVLQTATMQVTDADADADADLAKPSRVVQFRADRRVQLSMLIPAFLTIAFGGLLLFQSVVAPELRLTNDSLFALLIAALGVGLVARFLVNGRRERGLFLAGLLILAWGGLIAAVMTGMLIIEQAWPMAIMAVGVALLLSFLLERNHERGLVFPALAFLLAGGIALPLATSPIAPDIVGAFGIFWPLVILIAALALLPGVIRQRANSDSRD